MGVMSVREQIEQREEATLAAGAVRSSRSRGRKLNEEPHPIRTAFMRDRDRILHSKAFRRLAHKTQVFVSPEGDHHRVRLTHTLEVTQVARTISRALCLNEDLTESICLGHDLGHTPFGHLGEEVLSSFLGRPFRHNEQSLRIVDHLETRNGGLGLNLTWEVRDGILNHTWSMPPPSTLEAGVARYADRIAYLSHDIDDAIRAGVLSVEDLPSTTNRIFGKTPSSRIDAMVKSVVENSFGGDQIKMDREIFDAMLETRTFMFEKVYNRPEVTAEQGRLRRLLLELLGYYRKHPEQLVLEAGRQEGSAGQGQGQHEPDMFETTLVDYVAGMTDRFAVREHSRLVATMPSAPR